ncbi:DEAD/DEAH box helicase family protein [Enterococcus sp. BWB1-3]|uniref:DEAD/DEAH box helicase family protein n=1 Tax=Enterococcus sp. BWB1-3 TaxID=2787713 RepID=UPI0019241EFC|nr:DEAD/DEAH box helicase family protein [Enterococcus sp. BWB1-3]MBL1228148.1 DEAD/DEAH box helicase family protein [Enterococcus sp. BWB1-3]
MNEITPFSDLADAIEYYRTDPVAFFEDILLMEPDDWQKEVLLDLAKHPRISVRSGQGVGKTALEAGAIIWFLTCFPYAKVVATAPTMQQLYDVLWAEIAKWLDHSLIKNVLKWTKTKIYMVGDEKRWFATAKTATKPENMQGFHEDNMLFVVDEASGVADPIMEAILGTLSGGNNKLLMCGNPNRIEGVFHDSHTVDREKYKCHKVSSYDSKRTNQDNIDMLINKYGKDSDVVRVRIYGEFPKGALDSFISLEIVELASGKKLKDHQIKNVKTAHIGVDVARFGDDLTILFPRLAMKALEYEKYSKQDTMKTTGYVIKMAKDLMSKYPTLSKIIIKVDDTGVGGGVTDRLSEIVEDEKLPFEIIPVNNGSSATDDYYDNLGTQIWGNVKELLEENMTSNLNGGEPIIELPNNSALIKELSTRKFKLTSRGKIRLESKDDMKKRNVGSPDIADALTLAFYEPPSRIAKITNRPSWLN